MFRKPHFVVGIFLSSNIIRGLREFKENIQFFLAGFPTLWNITYCSWCLDNPPTKTHKRAVSEHNEGISQHGRHTRLEIEGPPSPPQKNVQNG